MTKETMYKHYKNNSAADAYILGFVECGDLYMVKVEKIAPRFLVETKASRGQGSQLRLRIKAKYKKQLLKKDAVCLGSASKLEDEKYNKGEKFEKIITEWYNQEWEKDSVPFWVDGDITVNNEKIQIKLDNASLTNEKQIKKNFYKRG